jgi:hypothetical protein
MSAASSTPPASDRGDDAAARTKIGSDQGSVPKGLGAASAAPAPATCRCIWDANPRCPVHGEPSRG